MRYFMASVCLSLAFSPCAIRADILFYYVPQAGLKMRLQGEAKVGTGGLVSFQHAEFGTLYFDYNNVRFYDVPSTLSIAQRKLKKAKQDPAACLQAARWALHHGLLAEFNKAASAAWQADHNHPTVERLAKLKRKMRTRLPVLKEQEEELRKYVPTATDMEFVRSDHFLLMHNAEPANETRAKKGRKPKKTPAERRLELLEVVYESFLLKFYLEGSELELPKKRLKVVLFADKDDYLTFSEATDEERSKASGFYDKRSNIAVFYDQGTEEIYKGLDKLNEDLREKARKAVSRRLPGTKNLVRFSRTLDLVCEVAKRSQDIEVVSHEATHQMAANTGLMPNEAAVPVWVAEGIATYFESPRDAAWAGIGSVNESRLDLYRALAEDKDHSNVDFVAADRVFMQAGSPEATLHAYGQAWALTHFLMAHHFDKLMEFYDLLAQRRPKGGKMFPPEVNLAAFKKVFGEDTAALNAQWHSYMRSLKTDVERVLEGE